MVKKEQKAMLREEYAQIWGNDGKMTDYCVNKAAAIAELPNGDFIPVGKQRIEKDFCFGESGYDYDDAVAAARHARTSEDYFRRQNMKSFHSWIEDIGEQYDLHSSDPSLPFHVLCIAEHPYCGQPEQSHLKGLTFFRSGEILEAMGGSAFVRDLPGQHIERYAQPYRIPTKGELDAIKAAYEQAAAEHAKKVDAYLKRYGTSKVNAWTYWRDA